MDSPRLETGTRAVSPVIAAVLLVAIAIVLAAGVASLLLDTGEELHRPPRPPSR